jgi:hypothetical protein
MTRTRIPLNLCDLCVFARYLNSLSSAFITVHLRFQDLLWRSRLRVAIRKGLVRRVRACLDTIIFYPPPPHIRNPHGLKPILPDDRQTLRRSHLANRWLSALRLSIGSIANGAACVNFTFHVSRVKRDWLRPHAEARASTSPMVLGMCGPKRRQPSGVTRMSSSIRTPPKWR